MPRCSPRTLALMAWVALASALAACDRPKPARLELQAAVAPASGGLDEALRQALGTPLHGGNRVRLADDGKVFDAIADAIGRARRSVNLLLYIWKAGAASDRVVSALEKRAPGVECRIVVDAFGSMTFDRVRPRLEATGCDVKVFRPLSESDQIARNHRKIVVVDGKIGVTGGFGVRDDWLGDGVHGGAWRDTNVVVEGPAVTDMQQAFAQSWLEAGGALLPKDAFDEPPEVGTTRAAFVASSGALVTRAEWLTQLAVKSARTRLWIENAYFVPDEPITRELVARAQSGVDVRVLSAGKKSDSKTSLVMQHKEYGPLVANGIRVWEYAPSMMHAKTLVIDDRWAIVGSINLEPLSLGKLEEGALVVEDPAFAADLARAFEADVGRAREITK